MLNEFFVAAVDKGKGRDNSKLILGFFVSMHLCSSTEVLPYNEPIPNSWKIFQALNYSINDTAVWLKVCYEI